MKGKIIKKGIVLGLCATLAIPSVVSAGSIKQTYNGQFAKSWSKTYSSGQAKIEYGFNTFAINEDICYAYHSNASHYAKISNGFGVHSGSSKVAGSTSKLEVQHAGSSVTYSCEW